MKPCITIYGCELTIPTDIPLYMVFHLNSVIEAPFRIYNITTGVEEDEQDEIDVKIILGFIPSSDLKEIMQYAEYLRSYVEDNPILEGFDVDFPQFHAGIEVSEEEEPEEEPHPYTLGSSIESLLANCVIVNEIEDELDSMDE